MITRRNFAKLASGLLMPTCSIARHGRGGPTSAVACAQNGGSLILSDYQTQDNLTGGSTTTAIDTKQSWPVNGLVGFLFQNFTTGKSGTVTSNTATTLTMASVGTANASGNSYDVFNFGNQFVYQTFGNYALSLDDFGPQAGGLTLWVNDQTCWGVTGVTVNTEQGGIGCYPAVSRGFAQEIVNDLGPSYTTSVGMGIQLSALTKCHIGVNLKQVPSVPALSRWDYLIDNYLFTVAEPAAAAYPPQIDISIFQTCMDNGFYGSSYSSLNGFEITIAGVQYAAIVDWSAGSGFHQPGGHYILLFCRPTGPTDGLATNSLWGQLNLVHDLGAIMTYFSQSNPLDDSGHPIKNAAGTTITSPLITSSLFINAVNAGPEIDFTASSTDSWITQDFWVAMQSEPDGP